MLRVSLKKTRVLLLALRPAAFASCLATKYIRDSGRHARTIAAANVNPEPMKYSDLHVYLDLGTTVRSMTAARRNPTEYPTCTKPEMMPLAGTGIFSRAVAEA